MFKGPKRDFEYSALRGEQDSYRTESEGGVVSNPLTFLEFPAPDPEAASVFYERLFGWEIERTFPGEFHRILTDAKPNMGIFAASGRPSGPMPRAYIEVEEPATYLTEALSLGGTKLIDEQPYKEYGYRAAFRDPWGVEMILWRYRSDEA
jgi:predicted enzyme related to lactoylglutathione lyase